MCVCVLRNLFIVTKIATAQILSESYLRIRRRRKKKVEREFFFIIANLIKKLIYTIFLLLRLCAAFFLN